MNRQFLKIMQFVYAMISLNWELVGFPFSFHQGTVVYPEVNISQSILLILGQSGSCISNDGSGRKKFIPTFPAACPYVTSVGGTTSYPEKAVSFSTGGFSDYFPRPDYQKGEVASFLSQLNDTYSGLYNTTGRGFPDVSAQASNFLVVVSGYSQPVSGTSASSPAFAGVISNLNDYLLTQGKPSLGFLNPWLYKKGFNALNDIISGNNPGCGTKGFSAIKGWDPVTGLGTPDFEKLRKVL